MTQHRTQSCKFCLKNPVWKFTNKRQLCKQHFIDYVEKKVAQTVRRFNLFSNSDKLGVAVSGGKDSMSLLYILNKTCKARNIELIAFHINEGMKQKGKNYREKILPQVRKFCKQQKIKFIETSFKKEYGFTIQEKLKKIKQSKLSTCYVCSLLKRPLLNKLVRKNKITKIATGHNVDDEAETIILNLVKGDTRLLAKLGPVSGIIKDEKFVTRIKPLYIISGEEAKLYTQLLNIPRDLSICPIRQDTLRIKIRNFLENIDKTRESKNAIVNSYLQLSQMLKERFQKSARIKSCKECGEPSSGEVCKSCQILRMLK